MSHRISNAMILAAGFGTRLRPVTDTVPKAMVPVRGKPLLDYALDYTESAGVTDVVVNTHYLPHVIAGHLQNRKTPGITISHEDHILETGGGIERALHHFNGQSFYAINADSLWLEQSRPLLDQMSEFWDADRMDALLALIPNHGQYSELQGDFGLNADGHLSRTGRQKPLPYHYMGVQIIHPRLFDHAPGGQYSLNKLYDRAEKNGRLFGLSVSGIEWFHISTPTDLADTERYFQNRAASSA